MEKLRYELNNENPEKKKRYIREMFDGIVPTYDFLNRFLSMGIDRSWRRFVARSLVKRGKVEILDLCSGTGDLTNVLSKHGLKVTSLDFSYEMLKRGYGKGWLKSTPVNADACVLPFKSDSFDGATIAFGIRNIPDLDVFMDELLRVLKKDGRFEILELTRPSNFFVKIFYNFYLKVVLPLIGGIVSGKMEAYSYLAETISTFLDPKELSAKLESHGFGDVKISKRTFGIATVISCGKVK